MNNVIFCYELVPESVTLYYMENVPDEFMYKLMNIDGLHLNSDELTEEQEVTISRLRPLLNYGSITLEGMHVRRLDVCKAPFTTENFPTHVIHLTEVL